MKANLTCGCGASASFFGSNELSVGVEVEKWTKRHEGCIGDIIERGGAMCTTYLRNVGQLIRECRSKYAPQNFTNETLIYHVEDEHGNAYEHTVIID
jgi:hypothetical protein